MAFKFFALFALIAAASAGVIEYQQPAIYKSYQPVVKQIVQPVIKKIVEHEEPANYDFEYSVHDDHTGDVKEQHESAKNGGVEGYYTLIDADGYKRIVHYTADDHHGFQAEVRREPLGHEHKIVKQVAPVVVKKIVAAPVVHKYVSAPVQHHYEAPIQKYYSAPAPVHHYSAPAPVHHYSAPDHYYHH